MPTHAIAVDNVQPDPVTGNIDVTVKKTTVVLTNEQIKSLPTTFPDVLPALGAGKMAALIKATLVAKFTAGAYTNVDITIGPSIVIDTMQISATGGDWIFTEVDEDAMMDILAVGHTNYRSFYENKPLKIFLQNSLGDFTGGHPDNALEVTLLYAVVDL